MFLLWVEYIQLLILGELLKNKDTWGKKRMHFFFSQQLLVSEKLKVFLQQYKIETWPQMLQI